MLGGLQMSRPTELCMRDGKRKREKQPGAKDPKLTAWCEIYELATRENVEELRRRKRANPSALENNAGLWGETPLHYAAISKDIAAVRSLIASGANVNAKDAYGSSVLASVTTLAEAAGETARRELVALLLDHGADPWAIIPHHQMCCYHFAFQPEHADRVGRVALRALFAKFSPPTDGHERCVERYSSDYTV